MKLFEDITKILEKAHPIVVNRDNAEGVLTQIEFDFAIEEEKPFLKNLFDLISLHLSDSEAILQIQHLPYRERYTLEKRGKVCVFDFIYNKAGFFVTAQPLESKCDSPALLDKMKYIVNTLK